MKKTSDPRILASITPDQFIGRGRELDRLLAHAQSDEPLGIAVLSAPGAGTTELLLQTFDRLFRAGQDIVPFYFAIKTTDRNPREAAQRYLRDFLTQTVAFRRNDPTIIDSAPEISELAELAAPADGHWIDRLVESGRNETDADDDRSLVRSLISAPLRAAAHGVRVFVMIDDLDHSAMMPGGDAFVDELREIFGRSDNAYVFAGARRYLFGMLPTETLSIKPFTFRESCEVAEALTSTFGVGLNDQTRDLIAVQIGGNLKYLNSLFAAAAERNENFASFRSVERIYTDEIFGGRIARTLDAMLDRIVPETTRVGVINLLIEGLNALDGKTPLAFWRRHLALDSNTFRTIMRLLNYNEFVSVNSGTVHAEIGNRVLADYLRGRGRLEVAGEPRALVVGEALTEYLKRAPQLLGRLYRRNSALGLRKLLGAFDCQEITAAALDYTKFKADLKGLSEDEIETALDTSKDKITLPQIVYTAHTAAFYAKIGDLIDDERSTIALGFEESSYRDETVWIAAEIDSKLEADRELTEFWCDRLEMVAVTCGFANYKLWLIANEGFSDDAAVVLRQRNAYGSSRRQIEILTRRLTGTTPEPDDISKDEYEIVVPMGDDTEMIAAHTVEDIARKHNIPAKMINQIKTALVEACINAAEHSLSPDRRIYQKFAVDEEKITVTVANRGLRLLDKSAREVVPEEGRRGWGLKLMKGLMDEVKIEQSDDGTRISMVKYLKPQPVKAAA